MVSRRPKMRFGLCILFLFCVYTVSSDDNDKENEEEMHRKKILEQLTKTRTVLLDDYHLVTRQTGTYVYMYRSYRTVSVIFYPIMRDISDARFTFQAEELHLNNIGKNNVRFFFRICLPLFLYILL